MAIQHNISKDNSEYGVKFDNAYYRIVSTSINRQLGTDPKFKVTIDLAAYATSSPSDDHRELELRRYNTDLDNINSAGGDAFLDKCYTWVMAQDDMSGSTAV